MGKPLRKKILSFVMLTVGGIFLGAVISFYIMLYLSEPITDGEITLDKINQNVEITYDDMGVPQIWAENSHDAYFALGYQHASDRMFQMDLSRRVSQGRLSEMMGKSTLDFDIKQRRAGHLEIALKIVDSLSEENRMRLQAYTDGINTYAKICRAYPFEYRFLPISFEEWTITDCLSLLSFQTWYSNSLMNRDRFYADLVNKVGEELAQSLDFTYPDWAPTTVDQAVLGTNFKNKKYLPEKLSGLSEIDYKKANPVQKTILRNLFSSGTLPFQMTHSSNAWVISPEKSESGKALFACDPHLEISRLPQFWYAVGIHIKDSLNVFGITTPGLPFVIMGHNGHSSWAFTVAGLDVTEFYSETINPDDSNEYLTPNGYIAFDIIEDSLKILGEDSLYHFSYKKTIHGPVINDEDNNETLYSMRWVGYDIDLDKTVSSAFDLASTSSFEQFQKIVTGFGALDVNMVYADADGHIGYQVTTPIPIRESRGRFPLEGSNGGNWSGYYPLEQTPNSFDPKKGWLASCNNLPMRSDLVQGHFFFDRILRINELLTSKEKFSKEDMKTFQYDRHDKYLSRHKNEFARLIEECGEMEKAKAMENWDGSADSVSFETALINFYLINLKKLTFEDDLDDLYKRVPAQWIEQFHTIMQYGWFDNSSTDDVIESYDDIAVEAMRTALSQTADSSWGEMLSLTMEHPMSVVPVIGGLLGLTIGPYSHSGTSGTLNASFSSYNNNGFQSLAGPSFRMIVDFSDVDKTEMVLPAGNSGNPMSDHFDDFYSMWKDGEYWTIPFSRDAVYEKAASVLILKNMESDEE